MGWDYAVARIRRGISGLRHDLTALFPMADRMHNEVLAEHGARIGKESTGSDCEVTTAKGWYWSPDRRAQRWVPEVRLTFLE